MKPLMDVSSLAKPFVEATERVLKKVVRASDASTIIEPQHQEILRALILMLSSLPQVAPVRESLERLLYISNEMQEANGGISSASSKKSEAITKAESEVTLLEDDLKDKLNALSSVEEQQAERQKLVETLSAKLNEANTALHAGEEEVARLKSEYSAKKSEAKKLRDRLHEINSQATQELKALEAKTSTLGAEASTIFETLKKWRAASGSD
jgi:chromosome segregation ATPase